LISGFNYYFVYKIQISEWKKFMDLDELKDGIVKPDNNNNKKKKPIASRRLVPLSLVAKIECRSCIYLNRKIFMILQALT
jgi:hypothetical protein